jgi:hypothetical protein
MKYLILLLALAGCDQYYRYPCQDPANWDTPQCKKPLCEVNRDCPELVFKAEEGSAMEQLIDPTPEPETKKGGCK